MSSKSSVSWLVVGHVFLVTALCGCGTPKGPVAEQLKSPPGSLPTHEPLTSSGPARASTFEELTLPGCFQGADGPNGMERAGATVSEMGLDPASRDQLKLTVQLWICLRKNQVPKSGEGLADFTPSNQTPKLRAVANDGSTLIASRMLASNKFWMEPQTFETPVKGIPIGLEKIEGELTVNLSSERIQRTIELKSPSEVATIRFDKGFIEVRKLNADSLMPQFEVTSSGVMPAIFGMNAVNAQNQEQKIKVVDLKLIDRSGNRTFDPVRATKEVTKYEAEGDPNRITFELEGERKAVAKLPLSLRLPYPLQPTIAQPALKGDTSLNVSTYEQFNKTFRTREVATELRSAAVVSLDRRYKDKYVLNRKDSAAPFVAYFYTGGSREGSPVIFVPKELKSFLRGRNMRFQTLSAEFNDGTKLSPEIARPSSLLGDKDKPLYDLDSLPSERAWHRLDLKWTDADEVDERLLSFNVLKHLPYGFSSSKMTRFAGQVELDLPLSFERSKLETLGSLEALRVGDQKAMVTRLSRGSITIRLPDASKSPRIYDAVFYDRNGKPVASELFVFTEDKSKGIELDFRFNQQALFFNLIKYSAKTKVVTYPFEFKTR